MSIIIGENQNGIIYKKRTCSYIIIERYEDSKIAIVSDEKDVFFFLGGGLNNNEDSIEALKREVIEETGYKIRDITFFENIYSYCYSKKYGYIEVSAKIYIGRFEQKICEPIEKDHLLLWVNPFEYREKLYHEYQRYVLNQYCENKEVRK